MSEDLKLVYRREIDLGILSKQITPAGRYSEGRTSLEKNK